MWAFDFADAETLQRMRSENAEGGADIVAAQTAGLAEPENPVAVTAIVIGEYVTDAENEWRFVDELSESGQVNR